MHVERDLVPHAVRVPVFMYVCSLRCASFGVSLGACVHPPRRTRELKHASGINKCPSCALVSRVTRCKGKQLACALLMLHLEMETPPAGGRVGKNFCACGPHHRRQSGRKKRLPADESAAVRPPPVPRNRRELQIPYGCTLNAISFLTPFGYLCLCMSARYAARHSVSLWVLAFIRLAERVS